VIAWTAGVCRTFPEQSMGRSLTGVNLMYKHYHDVPLTVRPLCPVCKKAVYSRGGIHPQCATTQDDPPTPRKHALPTPTAQSVPK